MEWMPGVAGLVQLDIEAGMTIDALRSRIEDALAKVEFTDFYRRRFTASLMRELYEANQRCVLTSTEAIGVVKAELDRLESELDTWLGTSFKSPSGAVGNGLYLLKGTSGSPRLPSVRDYAKVLVLGAARIGSGRVTEMLQGWLKGEPVVARSCAFLTGIETPEVLKPVEGMRLEMLPPDINDLDRGLVVDDYGFLNDELAKRTMLTLEYETICPFYNPQTFRESFPPDPLPSTLVNSALESVSFESFCRAMTLEINHFVDWSEQWKDYGEAEAFFLQGSSSSVRKQGRRYRNKPVSEAQIRGCLQKHALLSRTRKLDLPLARWLRSKRSPALHEQLIELRIALEVRLVARRSRRGKELSPRSSGGVVARRQV